ncbi:hypothetical protein BDA96_09G078100 [Sorghum bicolor]|uniref:RING-type domain-containing protein n=2 Tax=Sorghum bicolor TaxID=4558 RepID=A0A1B6P7C2_SORBI|nr:hypothetical protein BDA96_09G078100 [Sorghum bicolor]KXG21511.1 hypothetical protein SORBI_3009G073700 [Sorghum bicolor]
MAADLSYWMAIAGRTVLVFLFVVVAVVVCVVFIFVCTIEVKAWLGGVTTLRRKLNYPCTLCQDSMEAGDKVRTLSCDHAFHCGGSVKCEKDIDKWLQTGLTTSCPICRQIPYPVRPWKRPPPSSPGPSPEVSAPALPQLPWMSSTPDLEALLPPAHDETLPEASSSASAPPLEA